MFVQVIEGEVADRESLRRQLEHWLSELRSGAKGYLGSTGGVTDDGYAVVFARFESSDAARANSERPEQGRWWTETEKCFDGDVTFSDADEVDTFLSGGSDSAGFVQIMKGSAPDRATMRRLDESLSQHAAAFRPDLIGGIRAWTGPTTYVEAAYFTSEQEARANESKEPPAEMAEQLAEFEDIMRDVRYLDLREPWLL
jgi:hypothetical protein